MPIRSYVCEQGHEFDDVHSVNDPSHARCTKLIQTAEGMEQCGAPCKVQLGPTMGHVKGGTPTHHKRNVR